MLQYGYLEVFQNPLNLEVMRVDCTCTVLVISICTVSILLHSSRAEGYPEEIVLFFSWKCFDEAFLMTTLYLE